jgi:hypothetical protein
LFDLKGDEPAADAADDVRETGCAVHAAMLFKAEAVRNSL